MNLEEARNNIGAEVELDESTNPYTWTGLDGTYTHNYSSNTGKLNGVLRVESIDCCNNLVVTCDDGCRECYLPKHLKLKPQNYKISLISNGDAIEAQRLFFSIGYKFGGIGTSPSSRMKNIFAEGKSKLLSNEEFKFNELDAKQITLQELRDMVAKKKGEDKTVQATGTFQNFEPRKEMTIKEAYLAFLDDNDVEFLNRLTNKWLELKQYTAGFVLEHAEKFRLAPQRITLNGEYTKEELLQKIGEIE